MNKIICLPGILLLTVVAVAHAADPAKPVRTVTQYTVYDTSLESNRQYVDPIRDVSVKVVVTAPSGKERTVDAFWDGRKIWRIRISPDEVGEWKWRSECSDKENSGLHARTGSFRCSAYKGTNPVYHHGPIRLSSDRRYFEHADGTPFFWLADTAWNGVLKARSGDWDRYLVERRKQGFTVVQFVCTQWRAFSKDERGDRAYWGRERIIIEPSFFKRLDSKVSAINRAGLIASPVILWAVSKDDPGGLPEDQAILLARYITARWGAYQVIWTLGGDGNYLGENAERWKRIGRAVFPKDRDRLVTMHPQGLQWAGEEFRKEPWFDFIGYQSGHGDSDGSLKWLTSGPPAKDYGKKPVCPVINMEPNYEDHRAYQSGKPFDAHKVRRALYWSLLVSPTAGVTYGHHGIWPWNTKREVPVNHPNSGEAPPWYEALHSEGAASIIHLRSLFDSLPWWRLQPCPGAITSSYKEPEKFIAAAKTDDGRMLIAYLPQGGTVDFRPEDAKSTASARWYNPRTGKWSDAGRVGGKPRFTAPDGGDWVLCIHSEKPKR